MGELLLDIENGSPQRDISPSRLIKDSTAPPEVHRIVIEFNEQAKGSADADVGKKESRTLRRQPSSNLKGYMSA